MTELQQAAPSQRKEQRPGSLACQYQKRQGHKHESKARFQRRHLANQQAINKASKTTEKGRRQKGSCRRAQGAT